MTAEATPQTEIGVYLSPRQKRLKVYILNGEPKSIYDIQKEFSEIPNSSLKKDLTYMTRLVQIWKNGTAGNTTYSSNEHYNAATKTVQTPKMPSIEAIEADLDKAIVCKKCKQILKGRGLENGYCFDCNSHQTELYSVFQSKKEEALRIEKIKNAYLDYKILIRKEFCKGRWESFLQRQVFGKDDPFYCINSWSTRILDKVKTERDYVFEKEVNEKGVTFSKTLECFTLNGTLDFSDFEIYEPTSNNAE